METYPGHIQRRHATGQMLCREARFISLALQIRLRLQLLHFLQLQLLITGYRVLCERISTPR